MIDFLQQEIYTHGRTHSDDEDDDCDEKYLVVSADLSPTHNTNRNRGSSVPEVPRLKRLHKVSSKDSFPALVHSEVASAVDWTLISNQLGAGISSWQECQTCDQKVMSLNPGRSGRRIFCSRINFVCQLLFGVHSIPVLPQCHVKDPGHSVKSAGGRLHLNMHTFLTQCSRSGLTMPLSRHSVGTYQETRSHATRQGTLGHSHLSLLSHCALILA